MLASVAIARPSGAAAAPRAQGVLISAANAGLQARGASGLALLRFSVDATIPGWEISFLPQRKGYLGLTLRKERRIEIYLRPDRDATMIAHDIAHEIGHAVDVTYNTEELRQRYLQIRTLKATTPWWTCNGCTDLDVGAGDFAETFAAWAVPNAPFYSRLGARPTTAMLAQLNADVLPDPVAASALAAA